MTARTIARERGEGKDSGEMTARNIDKVTRYRPDGEADLEAMVSRLRDLEVGSRDNAVNEEKRWGGKV
jgi:large subunit ribosomal protein L17